MRQIFASKNSARTDSTVLPGHFGVGEAAGLSAGAVVADLSIAGGAAEFLTAGFPIVVEIAGARSMRDRPLCAERIARVSEVSMKTIANAVVARVRYAAPRVPKMD